MDQNTYPNANSSFMIHLDHQQSDWYSQPHFSHYWKVPTYISGQQTFYSKKGQITGQPTS